MLLFAYTLLSVIAYNFFYFTSISLIPVAVASILLYLSPIFVLILSVLVLNEKLNPKKVISVIIVLLGIILVVNPQKIHEINLVGVICGVGAGFTFALYNILGKKLSKSNDSLSIVTYSFGIGFIGLLIISIISRQITLSYSIDAYALLLLLGLIPTMLAFVLFNSGLQKVEASKTSIISTIEPVTAAILGYLVL